MKLLHSKLTLALIAGGLVAGCGGGGSSNTSVKPAFVVGTPVATTYDGSSDDLLTAGLGKSGLGSATAPAIADPLAPTKAELRRLAIYTNYRALADMTANGGYGTLYGPNVAADGTVTAGEGKIAGTEILAFADDGSGRQNVTLMVQVPTSFDPAKPCIVTATSSGSRGVYGAIGTGEWGLKHGCAVAYTDKGTGGAPHDLQNDTVPLIDGTRTTATAAGSAAAFRANLTAAELAAFNAAYPNKYAMKHAHSQQNPEKDWGRSTLQAVEFAFWALNERYGELRSNGSRERRFKADNTIVIASSLSNGGGAAIAAAELDSEGLIDGVAVSEPQVQLPKNLSVSVKRGGAAVPAFGKTLYDYTTLATLLQPCAVGNAARCATAASLGLVGGASAAAQAADAAAKLVANGWEPESALLNASHAGVGILVATTYASAYTRSSVADRTCGYTLNASTPAALAAMFATGSGVPAMVNADVEQGVTCLRNLQTGSDALSQKLQAGVDEVRRNGNLRGKPAIIVHGRSDALLPVNHTSRPYVALNKSVEGNGSKLSYIEVTNANHFDAFLPIPGLDTQLVPLHVYMNRALDAMWAHLTTGTALPPSQVVRTVPRGGTAGAAPAITAANVPPIAATPAAGNAITVSAGAIDVPN